MYKAMKKYGGSFIKSLAVCMEHADHQNYRRLQLAFSEYFEKYRKMAETEKMDQQELDEDLKFTLEHWLKN